MKKTWIVTIVIFASVLVNSVSGQSKLNPFFEKNGTVSLQTAELDSLADTIAIVNHRTDDVVWSRIVYRIIDMRDKQNYQLYFPVVPNEQNKSLFRLIVDAVVNDTLKAYGKVEREMEPLYKTILPKDSLKNIFQYVTVDTINNTSSKESLILQDPITQNYSVNTYLYRAYVKEQLKFLVQEIFFFDKHTSRMYSKIIGIAPIYALTEANSILTNVDPWNYFQSSVLCWFLFDELRPYLAKQYVIPSGNDTQRLTFDEFFAQRLYSSYLLGDSNMNNRTLLQYLNNPEKIRKEQQRIETELLNFEQDLWEY
jgi:gliding motility associated protien GldN